jgi:hypothetical protein
MYSLAMGTLKPDTANTIIQNMYAKVDAEGNQYVILRGVLDHRKRKDAIPLEEMHVKGTNNQTIKKTTSTAVWSLLVKWKEGTTS